MKSNHWICISTSCKDTNFLVQGLTEGNEYVFRVMAVNENGMSVPLEGTNPIVAKSPFGKCRILFTLIPSLIRKLKGFIQILQINHRHLEFLLSPRLVVISSISVGRNQKVTEDLEFKDIGWRNTKLALTRGNVLIRLYAFQRRSIFRI